jgi:hypothetical protein
MESKEVKEKGENKQSSRKNETKKQRKSFKDINRER